MKSCHTRPDDGLNILEMDLQQLGTGEIVGGLGGLGGIAGLLTWLWKRRAPVSLRLRIGRLRVFWDPPRKQQRHRSSLPGAGDRP